MPILSSDTHKLCACLSVLQLLEGGGAAAKRMGVAARIRVQEQFSRAAFGVELNRHVKELASGRKL